MMPANTKDGGEHMRNDGEKYKTLFRKNQIKMQTYPQ